MASVRRAVLRLSVVVLTAVGLSVGLGGAASASAPSLTWSAPQLIDPPDTVSGVSCVPTSQSLGHSFCEVVDTIGQAGRYYPTTPNGPSVFTVTRASENTHPLADVSCVAFTFCLAIDGSGGVYGYNSVWQQRVVEDGTLATKSISCASINLCALIDPAGVVAYKNGVWQARVPIASTTLSHISCAGTTCVIISSYGSVVTYRGAGWSAPSTLDANGLTAISCASSTFCVAIDEDGTAYTYDGATWSAPKTTRLARASAVSCVSSTFCVAGSKAGSVAMFDGRHWTLQRNVDFQTVDGAHIAQPIVGVSCGTPTFCMAVDRYSDYVVFDGTSWSAPGIATDVFSTLEASCQSSTFCTARDSHGRSLTYNGKRWTRQPYGFFPVPDFWGCPSRTVCAYSNFENYPGEVVVLTAQQYANQVMAGNVTGVSCATEHFCVAVDDIGETVLYGPSNTSFDLWGTVMQTDAPGVALESVSCATTTFCVALDARGRALYFNGTTWSAPSAPITSGTVQKVSCAAMRLCFAIQGNGSVLSYNGTTWTSSAIDTAALTGLSCAAKTRFCLALDASGNALTFDGTAWSEPASINSPSLPVSQPSCGSATFCMVVGGRGYVQFGTSA